MGSISRGNRIDRFVVEFGNEVAAKYGLAPVKWEVVTQYVGTLEGEDVARVFTVLKNANGDEEHVAVGPAVFDPENSCVEDMVEWATELLGISVDEAERRLCDKAELFEREKEEVEKFVEEVKKPHAS